MDEKSIKHLNIFLKLFSLGSNFPREKKTKCQSQASSPWSKKSSPMKTATSQGSNEFSLGKGPSSLGKKAPSPKNNVFSPGKGPSTPKNMCFNIFAITIISCLFLYRLVTYHRSWKHFNYNSYAKVNIKKIQTHLFFGEHGYSPKQFKPLFPPSTWLLFGATWIPSLQGHDCSLGKKKV